jgi:hypothetical protein
MSPEPVFDYRKNILSIPDREAFASGRDVLAFAAIISFLFAGAALFDLKHLWALAVLALAAFPVLALLGYMSGRWLIGRHPVPQALIMNEEGMLSPLGDYTPWAGIRAVTHEYYLGGLDFGLAGLRGTAFGGHSGLRHGPLVRFRLRLDRENGRPLMIYLPRMSGDERAKFLDILEAITRKQGISLRMDKPSRALMTDENRHQLR